MVKQLATLVLCFGLLPSVGFTQSLTDVARVESLELSQGGSPQTDWQRDYDVVRVRKHSGKRKMLVGAALAGSSLIFFSREFSGFNHQIMVGEVLLGGGGAVFTWGLFQFLDARSEMDRLNDRRPMSAASFDLTEHQAIRVRGGHEPRVAYAVSW